MLTKVHYLQNQSFKSFNSNDEDYIFLLLDVVKEKRSLEPYEELMFAVLEDGILTALGRWKNIGDPYDFKNRNIRKIEAIEWTKNNDEWLYSFRFLCEYFNMPVDKIRNKIVNKAN